MEHVYKLANTHLQRMIPTPYVMLKLYSANAAICYIEVYIL